MCRASPCDSRCSDFLLVLGRDVPAEHADERAVGEQQQRQRQRQASGEGTATGHADLSSKR
jgi:hypothetical protein